MEKVIEFAIVGKTPLLTHNPASMKAPGTKPASKEKRIPTPAEEAEAGLYKLNGGFAFPTIGFRNAVISAAGAFKKQKGRGTLTDVVAHLMMEDELTAILDAKGKQVKTYSIDSRRAVVQRQGIIRSRPRFDSWSARVRLIYDPQLVDAETLFSVAKDAGSRIGIGDYRPQRKGWFGRFMVEKYSEKAV